MQVYQRKRRRPVAEINVVPYIDVMLVLLIIFMVTAPIVSQGVKVDLPSAKSEVLPADSKPPLVAAIDAVGDYYLNDGAKATSNAKSLEEISIEVAAILRLEPGRPVVVKADKDIPYKRVIQLMASLQAAGVPSVGLMTESPEEQ
ncbi:MAG: protein TolR [Parashewanella sp.]